MNKSYNMNIDTGEKTWLTPPEIIRALGPFDLDPCCPPAMPWRTSTQMVHLPDDGLKVDWTGKRVWLNLPYGREAVPFLRKMAENKTGGVSLFCLAGQTLPCGTTWYFRTQTEFCFCADAFVSTGRTGRKETRLPRRLRSSRIQNRTLPVCATRGLEAHFCASRERTMK